jgi:Protein of unknown function (DUF4242)
MPIYVVENPQPVPAARWAAMFTSAAGPESFGVVDDPAPPTAAGGKPPHPRPAQGELYVVEERFSPPIDLGAAAPENPDLAPCLQRHEVDWVVSYIAADGSQCRCVYRAADAEAVRAAYRSAGMPFLRVWRARATGT